MCRLHRVVLTLRLGQKSALLANSATHKKIDWFCTQLRKCIAYPRQLAKPMNDLLHGLQQLLCLLYEDRKKAEDERKKAVAEYLRQSEKERVEVYEGRQKEIAARQAKKEAARQAKTEKAVKKEAVEEATFRRERAGMDEATLNEQYATHRRLKEEKIAENKEISKKKRTAAMESKRWS